MIAIWYTEFPGLLAGIIAVCTLAGSGIGAVIIYFANRGNMKTMVEAHSATVTALKESAAMSAQTAKEQLEKVEKERDTNRQLAHDIRVDLGSKLTDAQLRIKDLELRPDLSSLMSATESLVGVVTTLSESVRKHDELGAKRMEDHDAKVAKRMEPLYDTMKKMGHALTELLRRTPKHTR